MAYAKAEGIAILEIDILKTPLTGTQIAELSSRLNLEVKDLVDQEHDSYKLKFVPHNFSTDDWIKMIRHNPEIMRQPIALHGDTTILVLTPTDILKV